MHSSILLLAAVLSYSVSASPQVTTPVFPTVTAAPGTLGLGAVCSDNAQCANGAQCYGVTGFTIRTCGSFQSSCTSDNQCATNNCNNGFCNGFLASESFRITSTSSASSTTTPTSTSSFSLPIVTAAPNSLPLGAPCSETTQCMVGQCYGTTAFTIKTCGGFNAVCSSNADCATNTCVSGICSGLLPSGSSNMSSSMTASSTGSYGATGSQSGTTTKMTTTKMPTGSGSAGSQTASATTSAFTGAAMPVARAGAGVVAAAALAVFAL